MSGLKIIVALALVVVGGWVMYAVVTGHNLLPNIKSVNTLGSGQTKTSSSSPSTSSTPGSSPSKLQGSPGTPPGTGIR